jgi:hypothetical protein
MAQGPASSDLARLSPFVGVWKTDGELDGGASGQSRTLRATDSYEWLPGGYFLLHRFDADMPDGKVQGIEVIGYSRDSDSYPMHSFDSTGTATVMQARVDEEDWTFVGESLRFTGRFRDGGGVFAGSWEVRSGVNGSWQPLMHVTLRKVA